MNTDRRELLFVDRHRCQLGVKLVETPGRLRVEPKGYPMRWAVAWMTFVHLAIIGIIVYVQLWRENPKIFPLFVGMMVLEFPTFLGILFAISNSELAKGPLLEVDESQQLVTLLRENRIIKFEDIDAVFLLNGWYKDSDWERVSEMSLLVRNPDGEIERVPVLLHKNVWEMKPLAVRVADRIGKPIEQVTLTWKERQKSS